MGCYINPATESKEAFLFREGDLLSGPCEITDTHLPVCAVDNGNFVAAAVCFCPSEVEAFSDPDDRRMKWWFRVSREKLREVSPLAHYESL
jgi:hypothetical protein